MCEYLDVTPAGYYAWRQRPQSQRRLYNEKLLKEIRKIHHQYNETYGSPRMTVELNKRGFICCENTVAKIMRLNGIYARMERRYKPRQWAPNSLIRKKNLLETYEGPRKSNEVWVADFTYAKVKGKDVYLSTIMDLYTRKIIGRHISVKRDSRLVFDTLKKAQKVTQGKVPKIFHSDRGIEYANYKVHDYLSNLGIKQSMSGKGNCYDNAHAESFFHTYKSEFYYHERFDNINEFKRKTFNYISFYNNTRLHSSLGYKSPLDFEMQQ